MWNKACNGGEDLPFEKTTDLTREYEINLMQNTAKETLDGVTATGGLQFEKEVTLSVIKLNWKTAMYRRYTSSR